MTTSTSSQHLLLGVTGSVAAYKAAAIARLLVKQQRNVRVILTSGAQRFIGAETFAGITNSAALTDMYDQGGEAHVALAKRAESMLIAPASADVLARLASGRADDLLTATALCLTCPLFVAPAMHPTMWSHAATRANVALLRERGVVILGPDHGPVASGDVGFGRMLAPEQIVQQMTAEPRDLTGHRIVVSAGPTLEDIDPVRFIGNRSSGKMGFALAERAAARGAEVELVAGPVHLPTPPAVRRTDVRSALDMLDALSAAVSQPTDALIMAAAVGDYRPSSASPEKLKRGGPSQIELVENPDVIATLAARSFARRPVFVAFAVETGSDERVIEYARGKLTKKGVDAVVANHAADSFRRDDNRAHLITPDMQHSFETMSKLDLADEILNWVRTQTAERRHQGQSS